MPLESATTWKRATDFRQLARPAGGKKTYTDHSRAFIGDLIIQVLLFMQFCGDLVS